MSSSSEQSLEPASPSEEDLALDLWNHMDLRQRVASVLMLNYPGTDGAAISEFVAQIQPAGLIIMGDGIPEDESQLSALLQQIQSAASVPLLIAIDQEGGDVRRVQGDVTPGADALRYEDPLVTREAFATRAQYLSELGLNTNLGIVADVTDDPQSFIYSRVLGFDAASSAPRVAAAVTGERGKVNSVLKHFPGHGGVTADSHSSIPTTDMSYEEWLTNEASPFEAGIDAGAEMVMLGHLRYEAVDSSPASVSPKWVHILRKDLGFDGIVITDDMKMLRDSGVMEFQDAGQNAVMALNAGVTMILELGDDQVAPGVFADRLIDSIIAAIQSGELSEETLRAAGVQILLARMSIS